MAFVSDEKLDLLFDPSLISDSVRNLVGSDLHVSMKKIDTQSVISILIFFP